MGVLVADVAMTLDPGIVVIGGGLMDYEATTDEFRARYLRVVRETAIPLLVARTNAGPYEDYSRDPGRLVAKPSGPPWWPFTRTSAGNFRGVQPDGRFVVEFPVHERMEHPIPRPRVQKPATGPFADERQPYLSPCFLTKNRGCAARIFVKPAGSNNRPA